MLYNNANSLSVRTRQATLAVSDYKESSMVKHIVAPRNKFAKSWTDQQVEELRLLWWNHTPKEIFVLLPHRTPESIYGKASKLKLSRSEETAQRLLEAKRALCVKRNTTVFGRERNYESAKQAALLYKTRIEFYRKDISMYRYIKDNGLWDELCSHMVVGNFNYSETFLFECVSIMFPGAQVLRNSRKVIPPYELDIYLPDAKTAFEYDGSNWHHSEDALARDSAKDKKCSEAGIRLHRIKEIRKYRQNPEDFIIENLRQRGFPTQLIDKAVCSERAFSTGYSDEKIVEVVSRYTTLKDFMRSETSLYTRLCKKGLLKKYLSGLDRRIYDYSHEDIDIALDQASSATKFREKHYAMYRHLCKNRDLFAKQWERYRHMIPSRYGKRLIPESLSGRARQDGLPPETVRQRVRHGWTLEEALTTPVGMRRNKHE